GEILIGKVFLSRTIDHVHDLVFCVEQNDIFEFQRNVLSSLLHNYSLLLLIAHVCEQAADGMFTHEMALEHVVFVQCLLQALDVYWCEEIVDAIELECGQHEFIIPGDEDHGEACTCLVEYFK